DCASRFIPAITFRLRCTSKKAKALRSRPRCELCGRGRMISITTIMTMTMMRSRATSIDEVMAAPDGCAAAWGTEGGACSKTTRVSEQAPRLWEGGEDGRRGDGDRYPGTSLSPARAPGSQGNRLAALGRAAEGAVQ